MKYNKFLETIKNQQMLSMGIRATRQVLEVADSAIEVKSWYHIKIVLRRSLSSSGQVQPTVGRGSSIIDISTLTIHLLYEPILESWKCLAYISGKAFDIKIAYMPEIALNLNSTISNWLGGGQQ